MNTELIIFCIIAILFVGGLITYKVFEFREHRTISRNYSVSKFPVTSKQGNQYYVEILLGWSCGCDYWQCNIYERTFKENGKYKDYLLKGKSIHDNFEKTFDYIGLAKEQVEIYEQSIQEKIDYKRRFKEGKAAFEKWNGQL